jgi:hypothetical protein
MRVQKCMSRLPAERAFSGSGSRALDEGGVRRDRALGPVDKLTLDVVAAPDFGDSRDESISADVAADNPVRA